MGVQVFVRTPPLVYFLYKKIIILPMLQTVLRVFYLFITFS